jgi:hypothetical protein
MKAIVFLLAALSIALAISCATIISGTGQEVSVSSTPRAQIQIKADTGLVFYAGDSPAIVKLPRKHSYTITVQAGGYASQTMVITKKFNAWFVGNILFGGIPGGVVDAITGAMWNLEPSVLAVTLERTAAESGKGLEVVFTSLDEATQGQTLRIPIGKAQ